MRELGRGVHALSRLDSIQKTGFESSDQYNSFLLV